MDLSNCVNLTSIGGSAFSGCEKLESIDLSAFANKLEKIEYGTFSGCKSLKTLDLSNCVNLISIGESAFSGCKKLVSIDLPASTKLKIIDSRAFSSCANLKTLDLSNCVNLISIGESAFSRCKKLESIDLSACIKLEKLQIYALGDYDGKVKLPISIKEIVDDAFKSPNSSEYPSQVLVPNEEIKQMVIDSGYPEDRIKLY